MPEEIGERRGSREVDAPHWAELKRRERLHLAQDRTATGRGPEQDD